MILEFLRKGRLIVSRMFVTQKNLRCEASRRSGKEEESEGWSDGYWKATRSYAFDF
jgi:hypothetical protein